MEVSKNTGQDKLGAGEKEDDGLWKRGLADIWGVLARSLSEDGGNNDEAEQYVNVEIVELWCWIVQVS